MKLFVILFLIIYFAILKILQKSYFYNSQKNYCRIINFSQNIQHCCQIKIYFNQICSFVSQNLKSQNEKCKKNLKSSPRRTK